MASEWPTILVVDDEELNRDLLSRRLERAGYRVRVAESRLPLFCAGSTTHEGREGLWVFDVEEHRAVATPGRWDQSRYILESDEAYEIVG